MGAGGGSVLCGHCRINASGASGSMGEYYNGFQALLAKSLYDVTLKLLECGLDIRIARARIKKAEE